MSKRKEYEVVVEHRRRNISLFNARTIVCKVEAKAKRYTIGWWLWCRDTLWCVSCNGRCV